MSGRNRELMEILCHENKIVCNRDGLFDYVHTFEWKNRGNN
jgi:hypothetical protein